MASDGGQQTNNSMSEMQDLKQPPVAETEQSDGTSPSLAAPPAAEGKETVEVSQLYSTARLMIVFVSLCLCMLLAALVGSGHLGRLVSKSDLILFSVTSFDDGLLK